MKLYYIFITAATLLFSQCTNNQDFNTNHQEAKVNINNLHWLIGTWKSVSNEETSVEIWRKENDSLLTGKSYVLVKADTVFSEKMQLRQREADLLFIVTVSDQNKAEPVTFKFMNFDKGEFSFVNKDHDFPQRIIYKNPQPDFLCARIEGTKNGKFQKIDFNFLKVKN